MNKIEIAWGNILSGDFTNIYLDEISQLVNLSDTLLKFDKIDIREPYNLDEGRIMYTLNTQKSYLEISKEVYDILKAIKDYQSNLDNNDQT